MIRFGSLLKSNLEDISWDFDEVFPKSILQKLPLPRRLKKISGYIDKYVIFPKYLKARLKNNQVPFDLVHVIDHSNATYLPIISRASSAKKLITCHDLIAIRSWLKEFPEAPRISKTGQQLQSWILNCLHYSDHYACDSQSTLRDLNRLVVKSRSCSEVIHLGTAKPVYKKEILNNPKIFPLESSKTCFFLHVGSAAWYKNRSSVFRAFKKTRETFPDSNLHLILVGPAPQKDETDLTMRKWLKKHDNFIHSLDYVDEKNLFILYKNAKALLFPSHVEGFGWPPLEAAIQGCPVIATNTGAIHSILKNYAIFINAKDQISFEKSVAKILTSNMPKEPVKNIQTPQNCALSYTKLYQRITHGYK